MMMISHKFIIKDLILCIDKKTTFTTTLISTLHKTLFRDLMTPLRSGSRVMKGYQIATAFITVKYH